VGFQTFAFKFDVYRYSGVVCVSGKQGEGMKEAVGAMFSERKGRDVYVLGSANVGKSTFIRQALKTMREQGNFFVPGGAGQVVNPVVTHSLKAPSALVCFGVRLWSTY
jgi:hypothetical protein